MALTLFRSPPRRCPVFFVAVFLLAGCASYPALPLIGNQSRIRVSPLPGPDKHLRKKNFFFTEYLENSGQSSRRAAVLLDAPETPLTFLMNPGRYIPGQTGAGPLGQIMKQFAPLKLFTVHSSTGKLMGYALLPPRRSLRSVFVNLERHWLELSN